MSVLCSTTTLYHLLDSLRESPTGTALLNFGDLSYAGELAAHCTATLLGDMLSYNLLMEAYACLSGIED